MLRIFPAGQMIALITVISVCIANAGAAPSHAPLRDGERLEKHTLHTYMEIELTSREQARRWIKTHPQFETVNIVRNDGQVAVRVPKTIDLVATQGGRRTLAPEQSYKNGILITERAASFYSEEKARRKLEEMRGQGGDQYPPLQPTGIDTRKGKRTGETIYVARYKEFRDLVKEAQGTMRAKAAFHKHILRNVGEAWTVRDKRRSGGRIYTRNRQQLENAISGWSESYHRAGSDNGVTVYVGKVRLDTAINHLIQTPVAYFPKVGIKTVGGHRLLRGRGMPKVNKHNDGPGRHKRISLVWRSRNNHVVYIWYSPDVKNPESIITRYLEWYPSTWPPKDFRFDFMDWLRTEVDISIEMLAWFLSEPVRQGLNGKLTDHLGDLTRSKAGLDQEYTLNYELYRIERWVDTPVHPPWPHRSFPLTQAQYDRNVKRLVEWWHRNRDRAGLREDAPFFSLSRLARLDRKPNPQQRKLNQQMIQAVEAGRHQRVEELLEVRANPNAHKGGITNISKARDDPRAIMLAVRRNDLKMVKILVEAGATVEKVFLTDESLVTAAVRFGDAELVNYLLSRGASLKDRSKDRDPLLHMAAERGKKGMVKFLLRQGVNIDQRDERGRTPLMEVADKEGMAGMMQLLIDRGADVHAKGEAGWAPLSGAIQVGPKPVKILLEAGAKPTATMLGRAAKDAELEIVKIFLDEGVDPRKTIQIGWGAERMKATVIKHVKAEIEREGYDDPGETGRDALRMKKILRRLKRARRDLNRKDNAGNTK